MEPAAPDTSESIALEPPLPPPKPVLRNKFLAATVPSAAELARDAASNAMRFTESTLRKMDLAARAWTAIAAQQGWDIAGKVAISDEHILQFVHICLHREYGVGYGLHSFRDSYVPALFRHFDSEGVSYSDGIRDRVRTKIASMVKNGDIASEQIPREKGAEPMLPFDIERIADVYPRGCRDRTQVLAFMTVGLHTGLRGVSLESMLWKDTRVATPVEAKPWLKQLTLLCHATKGQPVGWNKYVTIEGDVRNASGSDPIYWLTQLLRERLDDPAAELDQTTIARLDGQLLAAADGTPLNRSNMSSRIAAVARFCGYPENFFSNHSLRSGFLCQALLNASKDATEEVSIADVFLRCALAASWSVGSRHMTGYVKQAFQRCLVSSRLIGAGTHAMESDEVVANIAGVGAIARNRLNPVDFHGLKEMAPECWPQSCRVQLWTDALSGCIAEMLCKYRPELSGARGMTASKSIAANIYVQLALELGLDSASGNEEEEDNESEYEDESKRPSTAVARNTVQVWVATRFEQEQDRWWLHAFVAAHVQPAVVTLALAYEFDVERSKAARLGLLRKKRLHDEEEDAPSAESTERKKLKSGALQRIPWSADETAVLCRGIIEHGGGKWALIARKLTRRSNVHAKDKGRVLLRQYGTDSLVEAAEKFIEEHNDE